MPFPARNITLDGVTRSVQGWATETGIPAATIRSRIDHLGWTAERALSTRPNRKFAKGGRRKKDAPRPCPELKRHPSKKLAYCRWSQDGRPCWRYFGKWGSDEAKAAYKRFSLEWAAGVVTEAATEGGRVYVYQLVLRWLAHCERTYRKHGRQTSEVHCNRSAMKHLSELYGDEPASEFDGRKLRAVREAMVNADWVRSTVNAHVARIVRAFAWAATESMVPPTVHQAIALVEPIAAGRRVEIPEGEPVEPVPLEHVNAVLEGEHLHPKPQRRAVLAAMVRVQLLTGMRPGELCSLRPEEIDRRRKTWRYEVCEFNKMLHREVERVVRFGPRVRAVLGPLLDATPRGELVFRFPPWRKGAPWHAITPQRYRNRVRLACLSAKVPVWTPNQLRHNRATEVMDLYESDEAAAAAIGNSPEVARQVYVKNPGEAVAVRIAEATG